MAETMLKHTRKELHDLQALPLEEKVTLTKLRVTEAYEYSKGNCYVSFSGGKDSTVLLMICRELYPDMKAVFVDTGLEFPEVKKHVKSFDNVEIIRPEMSFREVLEKYGWVYPSKQVAHIIRRARAGIPWAVGCLVKGQRTDGTPSKIYARYKKKYQYLIDCPVKIDERCCDIMKKRPLHKYYKVHGSLPIIGTMASESFLRQMAWLRTGCNAFHSNSPRSTPMSFWKEQDVLRYIKMNDIPIASIYGEIIEDRKGHLRCSGEQRTGCMFCPVGTQLEKHPNKFERMKVTHPQIYDYVMNQLGLDEFLNCVGIEH